jgi:hypothetical protein
MKLTCPGIETASRTFKYPFAFLSKDHHMGRPVRDLIKEGPFGRLTVISCLGRKFGGNVYWLCRCENCQTPSFRPAVRAGNRTGTYRLPESAP